MLLHKKLVRSKNAQSIFELCAITPILIIVCLLFLDLVAIIISASTNHAIANSAARAASLHGNRRAAEAAARNVVLTAGKSTFIRSMRITRFAYAASPANLVRIESNVVIGLPCPLAGWSEVSMTEAIVTPILARS